MTNRDDVSDVPDEDVLRTVEQAVWRSGVTGDAAARVAATVLAALDEAGFAVQRRQGA